MVGTRLAIALLLVSPPLAAQSVQGQLTDSITKTPLPGAFLTLVDEQGVERARTITNGAGEFLLTAPSAGTYRLRSKRIGFRPYVSSPLTLRAGETSAFRAAIDPIPVALAEVVVAGERQCDIASGQGSSVTALWDEIREALAAVSWTSRVPSYWYHLTNFQRELTASGRRHGTDSTWSQEGYSLNPIRNFATDAEFQEQGYVLRTDTGIIYRAPDADVLLSGTFLRTHCFDVQKGDGDNAGLFGLVFTSAQGRRVPDITGTLWVDRQSAELRRLQFRYIRLPQEVIAPSAGGSIEFLRLPSGVWIVRDWTLRMPLARLVQQPMAMGTKPEVTGFIETGGSIDLIKTMSGTVVYGSAQAPAVAAATVPIAMGPVPKLPPPPAPGSPPDIPTSREPEPTDPTRTPMAAERRRIAARNANVLTVEEFEGATAADVMALVQQFRPNWLHTRGTISILDPSAGDLRVYVNGVSAGDVNRLREYRVSEVRELRFLNAGEAQQRYGVGHGGGVIEVWLR